jgi:hypothetical protein
MWLSDKAQNNSKLSKKKLKRGGHTHLNRKLPSKFGKPIQQSYTEEKIGLILYFKAGSLNLNNQLLQILPWDFPYLFVKFENQGCKWDPASTFHIALVNKFRIFRCALEKCKPAAVSLCLLCWVSASRQLSPNIMHKLKVLYFQQLDQQSGTLHLSFKEWS